MVASPRRDMLLARVLIRPEASAIRARFGYDICRKSANADWPRQTGWKNMNGRVKLASYVSGFSSLAAARAARAAAGDRRAAGSLQHEAGRRQRPAGAQRLSADHPSSGRPLDRLYRPSRRHRRYSGAGQSADRQGRAERHLDRRRHRSRAAEISAPHSRAGRKIRGRRRADGARLRRQGAAQGRSQCGLHAAHLRRRGA